MKVVGLLSGGKDSCYNLCLCAQLGHEIVALATLAPPQGKDELDSYMYQTVGHDAVHLVAEAMDLPLYRQIIRGLPVHTDASFATAQSDPSFRDETEDLLELLLEVKRNHPDVEAVSVGAILSNYQRFRVETICSRLSLQPLAYLWQRDQSELLSEMIAAGVHAVVIKVAGIGLVEEDLGKSLAELQPKLESLKARFGAHVCGEGGEYETLTLDCPMFRKGKISLVEVERIIHSDAAFASVSFLRIKRATLVRRDLESESQSRERILLPPVLDGFGNRTKEIAYRRLSAKSRSTSMLLHHSPALHLSRMLSTCPSSGSGYYKRGFSAVRKGRWVTFCGHANVGSTTLVEDSMRAFDALRDSLAMSARISLAHIQHVNLSLSSQELFVSVNEAYKLAFGLEPPSRATVALPHLKVVDTTGENFIHVDGIAYDDGSEFSPDLRELSLGLRTSSRQALHVQSISTWAAANIGPYSQAVNVASRITIAGQIGLLPLNLTIPKSRDPDDGIATQLALSLQHTRKIFQSILEERSRQSYGWIEGGVVWLAGQEEDLLEATFLAWNAQSLSQEESKGSVEDGTEVKGHASYQWLFGAHVSHFNDALGTLQGRVSSHHDLPLLYVQLEPDALPKGAAVEWQLTGHDGRVQQSESSTQDAGCDYDDDAAAATLEAHSSSITIAASALLHTNPEGAASHIAIDHRCVLSKQGTSSFGVVSLRFFDGARIESASDKACLKKLQVSLAAAVSMRIFVDVSATESTHHRADEMDAAVKLVVALLGNTDVPLCSQVSALGLWTERLPTDCNEHHTAPQGKLQQCQVAIVWHGT